MGKVRFGIVEITENSQKTLTKVYNLDKFLQKNGDEYQIIKEFASVSELEIAYKEMITGVKVEKQREPLMFSPEYNKLHKIYYLGIDNPLRCMYINSSQLGNLSDYIGKEVRWILTPDYDTYSKWYDGVVKSKLNKN